MTMPSSSVAPPPWHEPAVVSRRFGDLRVHALRSGFVACKEVHRALTVPDALRLPAIALSRRWTEWMPVTTYVVDHPDGVFLVDAGQVERTGDAERLDCDPGTRWFYRTQLRLAFRPEERIDRALARVGVDLGRVRGVVVTHRHADHADGLETLPREVLAYVGRGDWPSHRGALPAHWPEGRAPVLVEPVGEPFDAFPATLPVVADGSVRVVPLAGHSPGHLGLLVALPSGPRLLFAGDAMFSLDQVRTGTIAGICEKPRDARRTLARVREQLASRPTLLLPAHEREALTRLERAEPATLAATSSG